MEAPATIGSGADKDGDGSAVDQLQAWLGQMSEKLGPVVAGLSGVWDNMRIRSALSVSDVCVCLVRDVRVVTQRMTVVPGLRLARP
eukprot:3726859-Rhodomonas_salina.3